MEMRFSQRIGKTPTIKQMQIDSMDAELRNGLWNVLQLCLFESINDGTQFPYSDNEYKLFCETLWFQFYKLPIDEIPCNPKAFIRDWFFKGEWYEVYDFLEFVAGLNTTSIHINTLQFKEFCNKIFESEFAGYRFIDNRIAPITNENEIKEVDQAISYTGQFTSLSGANIHLAEALGKLSDKKSPDYRNSIKESISAIESVVKIISGDTKDTLGRALDKIEEKIGLHPSLKEGFKKLYGYASDADGIRHALMEGSSCAFEDAKYMLVSGSAFINYLLAKAGEAGIKVNDIDY